MTNPINLLLNLSQKVLPGIQAGQETKVASLESADAKSETFSSVLTQALQQQAEPTSKPDLSIGTVNADQVSFSERESEEATGDLLESLPAELLALQPVALMPDLQLPPAQDISQLAVQATLTIKPSEQPVHQATTVETIPQAPPALPLMQTALSQPTVVQTEVAPSASSKPQAEQDSITLAQSMGFSTLSLEAMTMMGIPVEFQIQNAINALPIQASSTEKIDAASLPMMESTALNSAQPPVLQSLQPVKNTGLSTFSEVSTQSFDQALQQASPLPAAEVMTTPATESALILQGTQAAPIPESIEGLPAMLELPPALDNQPGMTENNTQVLTANNGQAQGDASQSFEEQALLSASPNLKLAAKSVQSATPDQPALQAVADLQQTLKTLNGSIETNTQPSAERVQPFEWSASDSDTELGAVSEAPPPMIPSEIALNSSIDAQAPVTDADKLPTFISQALDPADQVMEGTIHSAKNGNRELILKLNPDNLGEVRINLVSHGNNTLSAKLIASNPESHALLKDRIDNLKTSLEAQGVRIETMSVVLAGHTESGTSTRQEDQSQSFQQSQQQRNASQQSSQQQEQTFNQFFQASGQQKQGFAQNPNQSPYNNSNTSGHAMDNDTAINPEPIRRNDNGSVSLLA